MNDKLIKIDDDGVEMEWDEEKKGYFPKLPDDFILKYNLNYGFTEESKQATEAARAEMEAELAEEAIKTRQCYEAFFLKCREDDIDLESIDRTKYNELWYKFFEEYQQNIKNEEKSKKKKKPTKNTPTWFTLDESQNRHVYVENLPLDISVDEYNELMSKVGIIMKDPITNKLKLKLYKDEEGRLKGDGTCCYIKRESVDLALKILDGFNVRGNIIKVSLAKFELKSDFDPKRRRRITNQEKRKLKKKQEKLFSWGLDSGTIRPRCHNTVILKNVFDVEEMKIRPEQRIDLQDKLHRTLLPFEGFKKVKIHELNPEAVVQIDMNNANASDIVVAYFDNKTWNGKKLTAELWDGRTKYKTKETEEEAALRKDNWDTFIGVDNESGDDDETEEVLPCKKVKESEVTNEWIESSNDCGDKTPEMNDSGDKTPEMNDSGDKTPEMNDSGDKTPEMNDSGDKTPEMNDSGDKTPEMNDLGDKTPEMNDSGDKTPEMNDSGDETPDEQDADQLKQ